MPKRKRNTSRRSRTSACFNRRLLKTEKMKNLCQIMSKKNCVKSNGATKTGKRCRRAYYQLI